MKYLLDDSWRDIETFIPFGYGRVGKRVLPKLQELFHIPFVIDNNPEYQNLESELSIISLEDALKKRTDEKIVVLTVETSYTKIREQLIENGLEEYKDFCILERFFGEWFLKYKNQCVLSKIDTSLTFRCTLNCQHCAMFTVYGKREELSVEAIKKNVSLFFEIVDYVLEFTLLGGEPIIHKEIDEIIEFLANSYGDRIGQIVLISNGNVHPSEKTYDLIKKHNIIISISDYTRVHPYKTTLDEFVRQLDDRGIPYYYNIEMEWKDHGYPERPCSFSDDEMLDHLKMCGHTTHSMNEGRLYYCDAMYGAEKNTGFLTDKDDCLDFAELLKWNDSLKEKERVVAYCFGEINEKGYPSFCRVCGGIGLDNKNVICAGE